MHEVAGHAAEASRMPSCNCSGRHWKAQSFAEAPVLVDEHGTQTVDDCQSQVPKVEHTVIFHAMSNRQDPMTLLAQGDMSSVSCAYGRTLSSATKPVDNVRLQRKS